MWKKEWKQHKQKDGAIRAEGRQQDGEEKSMKRTRRIKPIKDKQEGKEELYSTPMMGDQSGGKYKR